MKKKFISEYEFAILKVLWDADKPLTRPQILERMAETEMNPASFHFAMNNLLERGYVDVAGVERCGTVYGRTYAAQKTQEDFVFSMFYDTQPKGITIKNVTNLMLAFVKKAPIDDNTIAELENMLEQHRKNMQAQEKEENIKTKE